MSLPKPLFELVPELSIAISSFGILLLYHFFLLAKVHRNPEKTSIGAGNETRRQWVRSVMEGNRDIVAVQSIRNLVMAATFMASTAILICLGVLSTAFRAEGIAGFSYLLNLVGSRSETLWLIKLLILASDFFFGFFNFTLAVRYYNHAGLMINVPPQQDANVSIDAVASVLNHGALHFTIGMRGFYLSVPLSLWLFGPLWMLAGSLILVAVFYRLDREN